MINVKMCRNLEKALAGRLEIFLEIKGNEMTNLEVVIAIASLLEKAAGMVGDTGKEDDRNE